MNIMYNQKVSLNISLSFVLSLFIEGFFLHVIISYAKNKFKNICI